MPSAYERVSKRPLKLIFGVGISVGVVFLTGVISAFYFMSPDYTVAWLSNQNQQKRLWAVDQLILKGIRSGKPALKLAQDETADPEARRLAVFVLGEVHYHEAEPALLAFFKGNDPVLAAQSAYALGRIGGPDMTRELVAGYARADKGVKLKIIAAMGELGGEPHVRELLLAEVKSGADDTLAQAARLALQKIQSGTAASR